MIRTNEIKAQMKRVGLTQKTLAHNMGMNPATLNRKINNSNGEGITVSEANKIANVLQLPKEDLVKIFFADELAYTQEKSNI